LAFRNAPRSPHPTGDVQATTSALAAAGAEVIAEPRPTPFHSTNARLSGPAGLQLTLFQMD
jgi:hypothetical protein